jgi:thiamine pyrophosphokinase
LIAVIFANGVLNDSPQIQRAIQTAALTIAANGGARHAHDLGITPDVVIGDFDSLSPSEIAEYEQQDVQLVRHPARKDFTDLELAVEHAHAAGAEEVLVLGALGNRWDQTLANLLMPASARFEGLVIRLLDGQQELNLARSGQTLAIHGRAGDTVSLVPLWGDALDIRTQGLEYPLLDEPLQFGSTRGISNVLTSPQASIYLRQGLLVIVLIRKDTHPEHALEGGL